MGPTKINNNSPRAKDTQYLYTKGLQYSLDGQEYVGEYHLNGDQAFTGPTPSKTAKILRRLYRYQDHYRYEQLFDFKVKVAQFVDPTPYSYKPTEAAYSRGFDTRFFIEKREDDQSYAIEIDPSQYNQIGLKGGIDGGLYLHTVVEWKLTGTEASISNYNKAQLNMASKQVPSIVYAVRNFTEFGRITDQPSPLLDTGQVRVVDDLPLIQDIKKAIQQYYRGDVV